MCLGCTYCRHLIYTESYNRWPFVSGFFSLVMFFPGASELHLVLELRFILWLSDTPSYPSTTFDLSVHQGWIYLFLLLGYSVSSVLSLSHIRLFATPWTAACQASLSITHSWSLLKLMSFELVIPSNHLILWRPLRLLPSFFPSIRVFSSESALRIR